MERHLEGNTNQQIKKDILINTGDGITLGATLFIPERPIIAGIIINSATAVKQGYYHKFAQFLADKGYLVLTYDYRGVGKSALVNIKDQRLSMKAWGEHDLAAIIDWTQNNYEEIAWHCIGHSVGGQIIGFANNNTQLASIFCVSSQSGYWGHWHTLSKPKMLFTWYIAIPLLSKLLARVPGALLGGESLPGGIAKQWAYWGRHKDYIVDENGHPIREGFHRIQCPIQFIAIDDDNDFAPYKSVMALQGFYTRADTHVEVIKAKQISKMKIGHFGFFKKQYEESLWQSALAWLHKAS